MIASCSKVSVKTHLIQYLLFPYMFQEAHPLFLLLFLQLQMALLK